MTFLEEILKQVQADLGSAKTKRTAAELRSMGADAPPVIALDKALATSFGLIAEIKEKSPSVGPMRIENVQEAPHLYEESIIVHAISVLTNFPYFGMSIHRLADIRKIVTKPILRKDFIIEEYQIREARAFGADAVLLMASVLDAARLRGFYNLIRELNMEALFEIHSSEEISLLPSDAKIIGINSRNFKSSTGFLGASGISEKDFSVDLNHFRLAEKLPPGKILVAESGLSVATIGKVRKNFHAALVGTSLLREKRGIRESLKEFERELQESS